MKRRPGRGHISETQPQHVRDELTRHLRGHDYSLHNAGPLPGWLDRDDMLARQRQAIARAVAEATDRNMPAGGTAGGDKRRLRGIPMYAHGVGGTMADSDPLAVLLDKERRHAELVQDLAEALSELADTDAASYPEQSADSGDHPPAEQKS